MFAFLSHRVTCSLTT